MNDTYEMWSLPWHALQRNLALGLGGDASAHAGGAIKTVNVPSAKTVNVQSATAYANSWLGRARLRVAPLPHQVRQ
jgi:hypothetical protein